MYSQLNYTIAQQHQAKLIQAAERVRLTADFRKQPLEQRRRTRLHRILGRITAVGALGTPRVNRHVA